MQSLQTHHMRYKLKEFIAVNAEGMHFNTHTGESFAANELGLYVIEKIKTNHSKAEIEKLILGEFNVDRSTIEDHLEDILFYMLDNHLIDQLPDE